MARKVQPQIKQRDLIRFKFLKQFEKYLDKALKSKAVARTHSDPRRKMTQKVYLSSLLFGMYNPVITSARALCKASNLERMQKEVCGGPISLSSFSEAQRVVEPELIRKVFEEIVREKSKQSYGDPRLKKYTDELLAYDGSVMKALARMPWAFYRKQGTKQSAVKVHVAFSILKEEPQGVEIREAKKCERAVMREKIKKGAFYVADRYYGEDYKLYEQLEKAGSSYLIRLRNNAVYEVVEQLEVSQADQKAGVISDELVILGRKKKDQSKVVRLVKIQTPKEEIFLVTNKGSEEVAGELVSIIYSYRWQIELFFKWFKCVLGCGHWFAESKEGVTLQVYCILIAAILLFRASGAKPSKRTMEMLTFYDMGYATFEELTAHLEEEEGKRARKKA